MRRDIDDVVARCAHLCQGQRMINVVPQKTFPRLDESLLSHLPPFAALDRQQIRAILDHATSRRVAAGVAIFDEGMVADRF